MTKSISSYSYTKSLRFQLEPVNEQSKVFLTSANSKQDDISLTNFVQNAFEYAKALKTMMYYKNTKTHDLQITQHLQTKKIFLKQHFKQDYYESGKLKDLSVSKLDFIKNAFNQWFKDWEQTIEFLNQANAKEQHQKTLRADIAWHLHTLNKRNMLPMMVDFIQDANHKSLSLDDITQQGWQLLTSLTSLQNQYIPVQGAGLHICSASLNYYTVNKKPKDNEKRLQEAEQEWNKDNYCFNAVTRTINGETLNHKLGSREFDWWAEKTGNTTGKHSFSLKEFRDLLKAFKAKMKSEFNQDMQQKLPIHDIASKYALFDDMSLLNKYAELTVQIDKENNKTKLKYIKKQRGEMLFDNRRGEKFMGYINLSRTYKSIAMAHGKIKAQIKGIKKEIIDSQRSRYWSVIAERNNEKYLVLIDLQSKQDYYRELMQLKDAGLNDKDAVYVFESLTMRALQKLCFAEESTFVKDLPDDLKNKQKNVKEMKLDTYPVRQLRKQKKFDEANKLQNKLEDQFPAQKEEAQLKFLKAVIKSEHTKSILKLEHFNLAEIESTNNLTEFEIALEKNCYKVHRKALPELFFDDWQADCCFLKITSYDLKKRNKNTHQSPASEDRRHTKEIWKPFWQQNNPNLRLNPEIQIYYREADENLKSYMKEKGFDLSKAKNRYLKPQITAKMSFLLNAGKRYPDLAFAKTEDIKLKIQQFNDKFNQQNLKEYWKYGIDRGQIELATVCLAKFSPDETYQIDGKTYPKPSFPEGKEHIKAYQLKKEHYQTKAFSNLDNRPEPKVKSVVANISYFLDKLDDETWFDQQSITCLDLTTAKVIKGNIINNGDILTYLKLIKETAKRKLYNLVNQGTIDDSYTLHWTDAPRCLVLKNGAGKTYQIETQKNKTEDFPVYFFNDKFDGVSIRDHKYNQESIKKRLNEYLKGLFKGIDQKHVPSINKINHLRKAIVANMVGVLFHLQKTYPGVIVLEDLNKDTLHKHTEQFDFNISRPLENALFTKLETIGLVPPHLKNIIELREQKDGLKQFGALFFVDEKGTSANCPMCEKTWNWQGQDFNNETNLTKNDLKFNQHRYLCGQHKSTSCDFDTQTLSKDNNWSGINDPDKVAAYNVAKRGIEPPKHVEKKQLSKQNSKQQKKSKQPMNQLQEGLMALKGKLS